MSNKTLLKLSVMCVLSAASSTAFAAAVITTSTGIGNSSFAPSSNVRIDVTATTVAFAAASQHLNGNRIFLGSNSDPKLYYIAKTAGTNSANTVAADASFTATTYSSL